MHAAIIQTCWPLLVALAVACLLLRVLLGTLSARVDWNRFRQVHSSQEGGIQSLAFVLTFPFLVMMVMFIVQISQLMIAQVTIHYAAFAGARAAIVWIASDRAGIASELNDGAEVQNRLSAMPRAVEDLHYRIDIPPDSGSLKLNRIRLAVLQGLMPLAPSRDLPNQGSSSQSARLAIAVQQHAYGVLLPSSRSNTRLPTRIANKLKYADQNTQVYLDWMDGFNSRGRDSVNTATYNPIGHPTAIYRPNEVGWQDPITVRVIHQYALLPGPGRFLAARLVRADGGLDRVSPMINRPQQSGVYTITLQATATLTNEGIKSIRPFIQQATY